MPACLLASPMTDALEHDDEAAVKRAQQGDLGAFATLVEEHRDAVVRSAARVAGADEAEDVAQDTFLRAFHRLDAYRGDAPFRHWLLRIAHNAAIDAVGRRKYADLSDQAGQTEPATDRLPADELETGERQHRLRLKLQALREEHRSVVVLRDLEGLDYREIAEITDTPLGSVKGRLHRGRRELIELLRNNTYDWDLPE
jgi:RNA polymerase sigma-70 factor, ECF subfamily